MNNVQVDVVMLTVWAYVEQLHYGLGERDLGIPYIATVSQSPHNFTSRLSEDTHTPGWSFTLNLNNL